MEPVATLLARLAKGETSSEALVRAALARIEDRTGEGATTFTRVYAERALEEARRADAARRRGAPGGPLAGVPVSVKDLFDVAGEPTVAGSVILRDAPPAERDAEVVAGLRAAGAIVVGKTNMTEFAFSGLGLNPHYGTPRSPWDRATGRIPGGSSSGAAVSVTDGMAAVGLGTDTGGSVRIPAAFCGLVGFKPTARRVSRAGAFPLSTTLDSIGPLAPTVACCAAADAVLSDEPTHPVRVLPARGLRFAVPRRYVWSEVDADVGRALEGARARLARAVANRLDADGLWLLTSQLTRDQGRNLEDATAKVAAVIAQALVAPRPRRPTRATKASKERRMQAKRLKGSVKQQRGRVRGDD